MNAGCGKKAEERATTETTEILDAMLAATQEAIAELEALAKKQMPQNQMFDEVKKVTESHVRAMALLGERFSALPEATRVAFNESAAGALLEKRMNERLTVMKRLALDLVKDLPTAYVPFGTIEARRASDFLQGIDKWPSETQQAIDTKCEFIRAFLLGGGDVDEGQRRIMLSRIDQLGRDALSGDRLATAQINGILNEVIELYPKEEAAAQYNLGLLYAGTGEEAEAEKWLSRAASQGFQEAAVVLQSLRQSE